MTVGKHLDWYVFWSFPMRRWHLAMRPDSHFDSFADPFLGLHGHGDFWTSWCARRSQKNIAICHFGESIGKAMACSAWAWLWPWELIFLLPERSNEIPINQDPLVWLYDSMIPIQARTLKHLMFHFHEGHMLISSESKNTSNRPVLDIFAKTGWD